MSLSELCIFVVPYNKIAQNHDVRDYVDLVTKGWLSWISVKNKTSGK